MSMRTSTPSASLAGSAAGVGAAASGNASMPGGPSAMAMPGAGVGMVGAGSQVQGSGPTAPVGGVGGGPAPVQQPPALLLGATFECSLSGSVHVGQFRHLYDRLTGLCEHGSSQPMFEHEMFYIPAIQRPVYPSARNDEIQLRLRVKLTPLAKSKSRDPNIPGEASAATGIGRSKKKQRRAMDLDASDAPSGANLGPDGDEPMGGDNGGHHHLDSVPRKGHASRHQEQQVFTRQYQICQFGHQEPGRNLVVRSAIVVKIQGDPFTFMTLLGYTFDDEYVRIGYNFVYNNACRIAVFRQYKLERLHDPLSIIRPGGAGSAVGATSAAAETGLTGTQQPSSSTTAAPATVASATASGSSTPISSANITPMATPLPGAGGATVPTPTATPTPASAAATPSHTALTGSTTLGDAGGSSSTSLASASGAAAAAAAAAATVVEPPWMIEISSAFVTQENVNAMTEEINHVRALLAGIVHRFVQDRVASFRTVSPHMA
ncbi:hypothetical protein BGZ73_006276 [Actinomortierella ambigua]|nr:hypothetical protein BGZ73_006276 [Actinomortierella ambigua]